MARFRTFLCLKCGFGIPGNHYGEHRRKCERTATCSECLGKFPCQHVRCRAKEVRLAIDPKMVPTDKVVRSLSLKVRRLPDGRWSLKAPWLEDEVVGDTWPEAYWRALKAKESP